MADGLLRHPSARPDAPRGRGRRILSLRTEEVLGDAPPAPVVLAQSLPVYRLRQGEWRDRSGRRVSGSRRRGASVLWSRIASLPPTNLPAPPRRRSRRIHQRDPRSALAASTLPLCHWAGSAVRVMRTALALHPHSFLHCHETSLAVVHAVNPDQALEAHAHHAIGSPRCP